MNDILKFFVMFVNIIFDDLNFIELSSLIVKENDLFECSAKLNYKNQSNNSNALEIENCFEKFGIKTTVIANNTYGICYEFFETNSSFILKEEDFVKIKIKILKQRDFIMSYENRKINVKENPKYYQYFRWYYFINDVQSIASKSSLISSTRIGLSAELKISKTSIVMLSVPYMTFCEHLGCRHDFYKLSLDNDIFDYNSDSLIEIKNGRKKRLLYNAEPSLKLVDFLSNIGGLFGLYFGLSFIDISDILKSITKRIKFHLQKLILFRKIKVLIEYLKLSQIEIRKFIKRMTKIPWKLILTFLSSPFFISQMADLLINYFQFSTEISYEFVEYEQKNQKILINEFPAITVCTEHMFEKAFFDKNYIYFNNPTLVFHRGSTTKNNHLKNSVDISECSRLSWNNRAKLNTTNVFISRFITDHCNYNDNNDVEVNHFLAKYFDINNEEEYHQIIRKIEDKYKYGLNGTLDLLDFYVNHHNCWTLYEPNIECNYLKSTIKMLSPFGKCHTYLMGDNTNETYVDKIELFTGDSLGELRTYLRRKFILHSSDHLPIWTSNQFRATDIQFNQENSFVARIEKNQFLKLPPPYDQKCLDYSESQQFECMNKCIEKYYKHQLKCFPNINNYYTIMVDKQIFKKKYVFCNNSEYISQQSKLFAQSCQTECGEPCLTTYYNEDLVLKSMNFGDKKSRIGKGVEFIFDNVDYLKIIWLPQLTIISLFIKIVNIWSLWHGTHFKQLTDLILEHIRHVFSYIFRKIFIRVHLKKYFNYEIAKVRSFSNTI